LSQLTAGVIISHHALAAEAAGIILGIDGTYPTGGRVWLSIRRLQDHVFTASTLYLSDLINSQGKHLHPVADLFAALVESRRHQEPYKNSL
jgi:hypothetical protein